MLTAIFLLGRISLRVSLATLAAASALALSAPPLLLQSCANVSKTPQPAVDVSGTWKGSTSAGCFLTGHRCDAYRLISLTFVQNSADLTGSYTCAYGTMNCLGLNDTGTIAYGRIEGSYMPDLRIEFPDATNCLYQGHFMGNEGEGGYMCFAGGGRMIEQGSRRLKKGS